MDTNFNGDSATFDAGGSAGASSPAADSPVSATASPSQPPTDAGSFLEYFQQKEQSAAPVEPATPAPVESADTAAAAGEPAKDDSGVVPPVEGQQPGVEPPKPIEDLRELRQHVRSTLEPKAKRYDEFEQTLQRYELTREMVEPSFQLMQGLLATVEDVDPQTGEKALFYSTQPFLETLREKSEDRYEQLRWDVLSSLSDEEIAKLRGLVPATTAAPAAEQIQLDEYESAAFQRMLEELPEDLHEIAKQQPNAIKRDMPGADTEARTQYLQNQKELSEIRQWKQEQDRKEQQRVQAEAAAQQQARVQQEESRVAEFVQSQDKQFYEALGQQWQPFGPGQENAALNQRAYRTIEREVKDALLSDPQTSAMMNALGRAIRVGDQITIGQLLPRIQDKVEVEKKASLEFWSSAMGKALQQQEAQRSEIAKQKVITVGGGFPDSRDRGASQVDANDTSAVLHSVAARLGLQLQ